MKFRYIQAPQTMQPVPRLQGKPITKLHPSTIPEMYRKNRKGKLLKLLYDIEWEIQLRLGEFNHDY